MFHDADLAKRLEKLYPLGTRVKCIEMPNDPHPIPSGTEGTVKGSNGFGQIHVKWDNGSGLSLIHGVDKFEIIK